MQILEVKKFEEGPLLNKYLCSGLYLELTKSSLFLGLTEKSNLLHKVKQPRSLKNVSGFDKVIKFLRPYLSSEEKKQNIKSTAIFVKSIFTTTVAISFVKIGFSI